MRGMSLILALLASPTLAETDIRQVVIAVGNASGCVITDAVAEARFPPLGLTKEQVGPVVEAMIAAGEAEEVDGTLHLAPALCLVPLEAVAEPAAPEVSPLMAQVIGVFKQNGCVLSDENGQAAMLAAGISEDQLDSLAEETDALVAAGLMVRDEVAATVTINEPLCPGAVAGADPAEPLIQMLRANGCDLTIDEAEAALDDHGVSMPMLQDMAESLISRNLARGEGDLLILENCSG